MPKLTQPKPGVPLLMIAVAPDAIHMAAGQLQHADLGCVSLGLHQHAQLNFFAWACSWLSQ